LRLGWFTPGYQLSPLRRFFASLLLANSSLWSLSEERANPVCQLRMFTHATKALSGPPEADSPGGRVKEKISYGARTAAG